MTVNHDIDRELSAFLRDGPEELPYESFDAVRDRTERTRQRVVIGPWRLPEVNRFLSVGIAAAAVVVMLLVGAQLFRSPSADTGGVPTATPEPTTTAQSTATAVPTLPPLTETFTSSVHGISVSYPEGWTTQAATEPWTGCLYCSAVHSAPYIDVLLHPEYDDGVFIRIASQPVGESAPEDWMAAQMANDERCTTTEPIIVDGATGLSGGESCLVAVVTTAGRGYHIDLWMRPDDKDLVAQYDRAWFERILASVQLHPEDAVD